MKTTTRNNRPALPLEFVKLLFDYDEENGLLLWRSLPSGALSCGRVKIGDVAGNYSAGYGSVSINGERYMVHRLVFTLAYGYYPENFVDHIDGNPRNNHHTNLREVTQSCNMRNARIRSNNISGVAGVGIVPATGKYRARINIQRVEIDLGRFNTLEEAVIARYKKEQEVNWGHCKEQSSAYLFLKRNNLL